MGGLLTGLRSKARKWLFPPAEIEDFDLDWSTVDEEMVREIIRLAEVHFAAQLTAGTAADSRAMTSASIFTALAAAIVAFSASLYDTTVPASVYWACGATAVGLLTSAAICFYAARSVDFYWAGNDPAEWFPVRNGSLVVALGGEAENYHTRIAYNAHVLEMNARWVARGLAVALVSPIIGGLIVTFS